MRRYMVVGNQTLGGDELVTTIRQRLAEGPCEFWIVVPATPVMHLEPTYLAAPVMGGVPAVAGTAEEARQAAQAKLDAARTQLASLGAVVDGEVGDPDPLRAAVAATRGRQFDEVIVSTLPSRLSRWLHQDLPHRLQHKLKLPVTHVTASAAPAPPTTTTQPPTTQRAAPPQRPLP